MTGGARAARAPAAGAISPEAVKAAVAAQRPMVEALFARLVAETTDEPGIMRDAYGAGENTAHRMLAEHATQAGLVVTHDAAANTYATWTGHEAGTPSILIGSHLDSVPHGGNFDGAAGVLAGLVTLAALRSLGLNPRRDVTVMGIRAEESVWFEVSYIGSRSALGTLPEGALDAKRIDTGRTLAEHLVECGGEPEALRRGRTALDPSAIGAFLELHIEQAPGLFEAGLPLGVCTGIPGNFRYPSARIVGRHDHVGTPRRFRRDAAMAGADFALAMDAIWAELEAAGTPLAITFGRFHTDAARHGLTTVPGEFHFSLDVRAYDDAVLERIEARMREVIARIEAERRVVFKLARRASAATGRIDPAIAAGLARAAERLNLPHGRLGSPASHDSAAFAAAGVPTAMLFIRNEKGSHHPGEDMEIDDFLAGCAVMALWVAENAF